MGNRGGGGELPIYNGIRSQYINGEVKKPKCPERAMAVHEASV